MRQTPENKTHRTARAARRTASKRQTSYNKSSGRRKIKHFFGYVVLFAAVFFAVLWSLSCAVKSLTPKISTSDIGVKEVFTLNIPEPSIAVKQIDSRLKAVQMEDDLPSVSIKREDKIEKYGRPDDYDDTEEYEETEIIQPPMPSISEIKRQHEEFSSIPAKEVIPLPKKMAAKVYLGYYASYDEAAKVRSEIAAKMDSGAEPFIKQLNGRYIVQLGSFSAGEKAEALSEKIRLLGYYPKISCEN